MPGYDKAKLRWMRKMSKVYGHVIKELYSNWLIIRVWKDTAGKVGCVALQHHHYYTSFKLETEGFVESQLQQDFNFYRCLPDFSTLLHLPNTPEVVSAYQKVKMGGSLKKEVLITTLSAFKEYLFIFLNKHDSALLNEKLYAQFNMLKENLNDQINNFDLCSPPEVIELFSKIKELEIILLWLIGLTNIEIERFNRLPSRFFLNEELGINLETKIPQSALSEREEFTLDFSDMDFLWPPHGLEKSQNLKIDSQSLTSSSRQSTYDALAAPISEKSSDVLSVNKTRKGFTTILESALRFFGLSPHSQNRQDLKNDIEIQRVGSTALISKQENVMLNTSERFILSVVSEPVPVTALSLTSEQKENPK